MTKNEILINLQLELNHYLEREPNSNDRKCINAILYCMDKVRKYAVEGLEYSIQLTKQGFINKGFIEILYLNKHGIMATSLQPKGSKDLACNKFYSEFKTLINPSNNPEIKVNQLESNKGYVIATLEGIYRVSSKTIANHMDELSHRQNKIFLTIPWVRKYATLTNEKF